jgi:hypothetical protein
MMNPALGISNIMEGELPTPRGIIKFNLEKGEKVSGSLTLPINTSGEFLFGDQKMHLKVRVMHCNPYRRLINAAFSCCSTRNLDNSVCKVNHIV